MIAAAGAVAGSAVTGMVVYRIARLERDAADRGELRSALAAYGAAIDRLTLKIHQLPQAHGIEDGRSNKLVARWPTLDWVIGRLSVATGGRSTMRVVDEVIFATNRLVLVAPEPIVETMQAITDLVGVRSGQRGLEARLAGGPKRLRWSFEGTLRSVRRVLKPCPEICPPLHRTRLNWTDLLGRHRHETGANGSQRQFIVPWALIVQA